LPRTQTTPEAPIVDPEANVAVVLSTSDRPAALVDSFYILNVNVELRPKEIERAQRAYTSSAVCSN